MSGENKPPYSCPVTVGGGQKCNYPDCGCSWQLSASSPEQTKLSAEEAKSHFKANYQNEHDEFEKGYECGWIDHALANSNQNKIDNLISDYETLIENNPIMGFKEMALYEIFINDLKSLKNE